MSRRIITTENLEEDVKIESHLRPQLLDDYIGQEKAKEILKVYITAARERGEALDHVLFYGPPGLGKTTLAGIIANEMHVNIKITSGPAIWKLSSESFPFPSPIFTSRSFKTLSPVSLQASNARRGRRRWGNRRSRCGPRHHNSDRG